ncbi:hypothetical protein [Flavobacterium sp. RSP46]|uniref:hypothetical protein n=1 Tax=Flavobacterium sp. RSP46 TaxID=2497486 RepID=UPI000F8779C8|nr:hypothetical protein [Flavobacterium sp. RSP46]
MAQKFCKIFEVEEHQVLYQITEDDESNECIETTTIIDDLRMSTKMSGFEKNNTTADIQFEKINQAFAESFFQAMKNLTQ